MGILTYRWTKATLLSLTLFILIGCKQEGDNTKTMEMKQPKGRVRISGSASAMPLVKLLARELERYHPETEVLFLPETHTKGGLAGVREGDSDIGLLSRWLTEEEAKYDLQYLHLAQDGIVFATHKTVTIKDITTQQLKEIYSGKITNWRQLGWKDREINVLDRPEHTSPKIVLRRKLFGKDLEMVKTATVLERPGQMVESLKVMPYSIGYTSLGEVISSELDVNVLNVDGIPPTPANVEKTVYPFSRPFGMVIHSLPKKGIMKFVDFIYSNPGIRIIESSGYVPIMSHFLIATIPESNVIRQEERYRPLVDYLSQQLGMRVKIDLRHLPSYQEIVDEFIEGRVNAAFLGSFVYALTQAKVGVETVARPVKDGVSQYRGLIFCRKDSGIKDWRDLKGRSFAMIRATTAGELFPMMFFKNHGVDDLDSYLGKIYHVGSHDVSILKVLNGEIEAGSAKDLIYEKLAREDPRVEREMLILARSAPVPENALVVRKNIDFVCFNCHTEIGNGWSKSPYSDKGFSVNLKQALKEILLSLPETAEGRRVLRQFGADRFVGTTHEDYRELYHMIGNSGIDLKSYPYGNKE